MNIAFRRLTLAMAAVIALSVELWGQSSTRTPAQDTFRQDAFTPSPYTDMIRGDTMGQYVNGSQCVNTWVDNHGYFFLRTLTSSCSIRWITLDFSQAVTRPVSCPYSISTPYGLLDICGSNNAPDVRVLASALFASTALTKGTSVTLPFNLNPYPCFCGSDGGGFELDFEQNVPVTGTSSTRSLTAASNAVVDLYQYVNSRKVSWGRYNMPFGLTVTKQ